MQQKDIPREASPFNENDPAGDTTQQSDDPIKTGLPVEGESDSPGDGSASS